MNQVSLIRALARSRAFPDHPRKVRLVQTHLSYVFLTPTRVYKIKKAVDLGFADFSTLARRRRFCRVEVEINRRLAPRVYLGVEPVVLVSGRPVVGVRGGAVEYAVVMRRLPDSRLLSRQLRRGPGDYPLVTRVADRLARFYGQVKLATGDRDTGAGPLARVVRDNFKVLERFSGDLFNAEALASLRGWSERELAAMRPRIEQRARAGRSVEGHGDLHLAHIYVNDEIEILDGTEFSRRFRAGDYAKDVAFLAMDLEARDRHDLSRHFIRILARRLHDPDLPRLLPFYKAYRALVRAKVNALLAGEREVPIEARQAGARRARRYFKLAERITRWRGAPALIVMGGLTGVGKTVLALDIARRYGAEWVATDVLRKLLAGTDPFQSARASIGQGLYSPAHRRATLRAVLREARSLLRAGRPVILDGTFQRREDRAAVRRLARREGAEIRFLWCEAPLDVVRRRFRRRAARASFSDADWKVYLAMRKRQEPPVEIPPSKITFLDTTRAGPVLRRRIDALLGALASPPSR